VTTITQLVVRSLFFAPKKKKKSTKNGDIHFKIYIYKNQVIFLVFGNKNLKILCKKKLGKKMIPKLFNPKINNKVVEKTCLSKLKTKYHIA